jgi:hypothetical protein
VFVLVCAVSVLVCAVSVLVSNAKNIQFFINISTVTNVKSNQLRVSRRISVICLCAFRVHLCMELFILSNLNYMHFAHHTELFIVTVRANEITPYQVNSLPQILDLFDDNFRMDG